jgi:hypothetical protein
VGEQQHFLSLLLVDSGKSPSMALFLQPQVNGLVVDVAVLLDTSKNVGVDAQESRSW